MRTDRRWKHNRQTPNDMGPDGVWQRLNPAPPKVSQKLQNPPPRHCTFHEPVPPPKTPHLAMPCQVSFSELNNKVPFPMPCLERTRGRKGRKSDTIFQHRAPHPPPLHLPDLDEYGLDPRSKWIPT